MNSFINEFEISIESAKQNRQSFIQFINDIEITQVKPWVNEWLEKSWTDDMSNVFFDEYWNGSFDVEAIDMEYEVLPSILDDIEKCMVGA